MAPCCEHGWVSLKDTTSPDSLHPVGWGIGAFDPAPPAGPRRGADRPPITDPSSPLPLYDQICEQLRTWIISGALQPETSMKRPNSPAEPLAVNGRRYLDSLPGSSAAAKGHNKRRVFDAMCEQFEQIAGLRRPMG